MKNSLGYEIIKHKIYCNCGLMGTYNDKYDLYFCKSCDKWLEEACNCQVDTCIFTNPPTKPSEIND